MTMKILLVEDDAEIVNSITLAFQFYLPEVQLLTTHLGKQAVKIVKKEQPAAIILDLGLPDITGFDVLKKVRQFSDVPVIILTVRTYEEDVLQAIKERANDFVAKPFRQLDLIKRLKALLESAADTPPASV